MSIPSTRYLAERQRYDKSPQGRLDELEKRFKKLEKEHAETKAKLQEVLRRVGIS